MAHDAKMADVLSQGYVYLAMALVALLGVLLTKRSRTATAQRRLPPGPWQLPVIGSLHHLIGKLPHHAMRDLTRRHGPVMMLRLGEVPTLVVSSPEAAQEVMRTHDAVFATRALSATVRAGTMGGRDIAFAPYGDYWRQLRKIAATELLSAPRVASFRAIREEEVAGTLRTVAAAAADGRAVELRAALCALVTDSTSRAVVGDRCKESDALIRAFDRSMELASGFNPADLWPSSRLAGLLSGGVREIEANLHTVFGILDRLIEKRLQQKKTAPSSAAGEDILDALLRIHKEGGGLQFPLDMDSIKLIIADLFSGGGETVATLLVWAMAELIRNPMAMQKATTEVRRAFALAGAVSEGKGALGELRYLHLVIKEASRLHPPAPLLLPRECSEPCQVLGYDVPRGTQVLVNAWAIGRDERCWTGGSGDGRLARGVLAGADGAEAVDLRGNNFELLPFGAGRRMCPGMAFALANIELTLASLLFHFDWEVPDMADPAKLDMTETLGITARRKGDLLLRPVLRMPVPGIRLEEEGGDGIHKDGGAGGLQVPLDMDDITLVITNAHARALFLTIVSSTYSYSLFNDPPSLHMQDLFSGGGETVATLLVWAMAELIRNPMAMQKATAEVRRAFALPGVVSEGEGTLGELRYLHLVIRETFRLHPPGPLLLPRECSEPCQVLGYDVPRGTQVLVNVWAIGRDERCWLAVAGGGSPEEFWSERFEDGAEAVDLRGNNFELLPFGAGRRMCPGVAFALANIELTLASLLFHFDWEVPGMADPAKLDMTETRRRSSAAHGSGALRLPPGPWQLPLDRSIELVVGFNPADLWPSSRLAGCLTGTMRQAKKCWDTMSSILESTIQEHLQKNSSGGRGGAEATDEDLIDVLLRIQKEGGLQFPFDMDVIKSVIHLIRNPAAMKKATIEVRQTFAAAGVVSEAALSELRYLHLVIKETLRLHPPGPLLLPRECREQCKVLGYDVPRGTQVLVNAWAIGHDERDGEPAAVLDFKGTDFELLPFGAGRRMCPGMAFGLANMELPLASLLFHFDWEVPGMTDPTKLDMTEAFGISVRRKADLIISPILRVPPSAQASCLRDTAMADGYFYFGLALVSLLVVLFAKRRRSAAAAHGDAGLRLPPGPWQLPVIGSLHHLAGKLPHHAMRDLARRHGPLMTHDAPARRGAHAGEVPGLLDPAEFDMTEAFGISVRRKADLVIRPILRVPVPGV
uniref:Cytochrome P450 n=1 Tax=Oryza barthii TaxID=65489 RepID=A0A0D3GJ43_9ORYZ